MKKLLLSLGTATTAIAPLATVVACSGELEQGWISVEYLGKTSNDNDKYGLIIKPNNKIDDDSLVEFAKDSEIVTSITNTVHGNALDFENYLASITVEIDGRNARITEEKIIDGAVDLESSEIGQLITLINTGQDGVEEENLIDTRESLSVEISELLSTTYYEAPAESIVALEAAFADSDGTLKSPYYAPQQMTQDTIQISELSTVIGIDIKDIYTTLPDGWTIKGVDVTIGNLNFVFEHESSPLEFKLEGYSFEMKALDPDKFGNNIVQDFTDGKMPNTFATYNDYSASANANTGTVYTDPADIETNVGIKQTTIDALNVYIDTHASGMKIGAVSMESLYNGMIQNIKFHLQEGSFYMDDANVVNLGVGSSRIEWGVA